MTDLFNGFGSRWIEYFGPSVFQNTLFLGFVFVALFLARTSSAQVRYVIGLVGLFKLLLPPFLPFHWAAEASRALTSMPLLAPSPDLPALSAGTVPDGSGGAALGVSGFLFALWASAATLYLVASALSTSHLALRLRRAQEVRNDSTLGAVAGIRLFKSDRIAVPLTFGFFPKSIFVPQTWDEWSPECKTTAIRHEVAHIRRFDGLFQGLQILAQALYIFHPLVWLLNRRLTVYREMACDDRAAGTEARSRLEYSKNLVEIVEAMTRDPLTCQSASALVGQKDELLKRVGYQMKEGIMRPVSKKRLAAAVGVLVLLIIPLSWYNETANSATPGASPGRNDETRKPAAVEVNVNGKQDIVVAGQPSSLADFAADVKREAERREGDVVINFACADEVSMATVFAIHRKLRDLDLLRVNYVTGSGAEMPLALPSSELEKKMRAIPEGNIAHVFVMGAGEVVLDNQKTEIEKLSRVIATRLADNSNLIVSVHTDGAATYADFVTTLIELKKADARRIFVNDPPR